jgi:hypothetical protein
MDRRVLRAVEFCLAFGFLCAIAPSASAQVSCSGLPAFASCTAYATGTSVTYNGAKYTSIAPIPANRDCPPNSPYNPAVDNWWTNNGTCTAGGATATATRVPTATPTTGTTATPTSASGGGGGCAAAWVSTTAYVGGSVVSRTCGSTTSNYTAAFWTQGNDPCTNSGPAGSGDPWGLPTSCSGSGGGGGGAATPTVAPCTNCTSVVRAAPYVDISLATGSQVASNVAAAGLPGVTLAFLVDGGCVAVWGGGLGNVSSAMFPNGTSVQSAINAITASGRKVIISWGGANGSALSSCGSASSAQAMYQSVYSAYPNISGQDFDIEGGVNTTILGQALAGLKSANSGKAVSLTLPVLPTGLVSAGLSIVNACHSAGLRPDTVNVMAMDYGSANDNGGNMLLSAQQAAQSTRTQTGDPIGVTPMIGVNDTSTEIFTISNASSFVSWAKGQSYINRLAFWSLSRDNGGCAGQTFASPTCSGVSQSMWQFSGIFAGF